MVLSRELTAYALEAAEVWYFQKELHHWALYVELFDFFVDKLRGKRSRGYSGDY